MSRRDELKRRLAERKADKRRRVAWLTLLLLLLLLLLLCSRCTCAPTPVGEPVAPPPAPIVEEPEPEPVPLPVRPPMERIDRPAFDTEPLTPLPWLDAFRMQVAARSPRLAECFVGAERPGRLRWSGAVEPSKGRISQQAIEPVRLEDVLTAEQRDCVAGVLEDPPYELPSDEAASTPTRVSLVVEF